MGSHANNSKTAARRLFGAVVAVAVLVGCGSAGVSVAPQTTQLPLGGDDSQPPVAIVALDVVATEENTNLEIHGSSPLTWTSYRAADDTLVVELSGAKPAAELAELDLARGLIAGLEIESEGGAGSELTKLLISTVVDAEHSVIADGSKLIVGLQPLEAWTPEVIATVASVNGDPVSASYAVQEDETGAPDEPSLGPAPTGVPATQLHGVDVATGVDSTVVTIGGDGSFYYSTFALENPHRFVVDLIGVVNTSPVSTITVQGPLVDGVRVAQYKPQPELVSRVVVDLLQQAVPEVEATSDGLRLTFFEDAEFAAVEPAAEAEADEAPAEAETVMAAEPEPSATEVELAAVEMPVATEDMGAEPASVASLPETGAEAMAVAEPAYEEPEVEALAVEEPVYEEPVYEEPEAPAVEAPAVEEPEVPAVEAPAEPEWEAAAVEPAPMAAPEPQAEIEPEWEEPSVEPAAVAESWPPAAVEEPPADPWPAAPEPPAGDPHGYADEPLPSEASLLDFAATDITPVDEPAGSAFGTREVGDDAADAYRGEPMTMTLRDADIKDVLRSFAQISGLNVVVQPEVSGTVTVELTNVPWDQALDQILKINGLGYQLEGNIMRVAPLETLRAEEEAKARLAEAKARSIPLKTIMRRVSYAGAEEIAGILRSGGGASIMSARGSAVVDKRTNTLIIKELPSHINTVIAVIENLDIPEPQVMIEARIIETTKRFSQTLGVQWGFSGIADPRYGNTTGLQFPNRGTVDGGVELLTGGSNGFLDITLGNVLNSFNLDIALQAAENEGLINILSAPKITTLNNEQATIQSGLQIPIQTIANNTVSVQFVNATLRLEVTPHVTAEGTVLMDIDIQKREPQLAFAVVGAANAPIATKDASTRVIVRDGGTTVIGGIYKVTSDQGEDRVPGLSNVPILKHLFKNKRRNDENEELLIFITPRVIRL